MARIFSTFASLLIISILAFVPMTASALAQKIGTVGAMNGTVNAKKSSGDTQALRIGAAIYLNDEIMTGPNGSAQLMFLDKSALTISPDSNVIIDKFVYNPAAGDGEMVMQSAKGALRFIGGALSKKQPVKLKTPVSTIGIRGAIADAHVDANTGATDAVFLYGKELSVTNLDGQTQVTTTFGTGLSLPTANAIPQPMPAAAVQQRINASPVNAARTVAPATPANNAPLNQKLNKLDSNKQSGGNAGSSDSSSNNSAAPAPAGETNTANNSGNQNVNSTNSAPSPLASNRAADTGSAAPQAQPNATATARPAVGTPGTLPTAVPFRVATPTVEAPQINVGALGATTLNERVRTVVRNPDATVSNDQNRLGGLLTNVRDVAGINNAQDTNEVLAPTLSDNDREEPAVTEVVTRDEDTDRRDPIDTTSRVTSNNGGGGSSGSTTVSPPPFVLFGQQNTFDSAGSPQNTIEGIALRENSDGTKFTGEIQPIGGNATPFSLDTETAGVQTSASGELDSAPLTGTAFVSPEGTINYYDMNDGTNRHTFLFGKRVVEGTFTAAAGAGTAIENAARATALSATISHNGTTYYNFLPQVSGDGSNYGFVKGNRPQGLSSSSYDVGLAVDWDRKQYNYSEMNWLNGKMNTAFGRIDNPSAIALNSDGQVQSGNIANNTRVFDYESGTARLDKDKTIINTRNLFGSGNDGIEGFTIKDSVTNSTQPVLVDTTINPSSEGIKNRTNEQVLSGFAAGFITTDSGASSPNVYWNTAPINEDSSDTFAKITRSSDGNDIGGHFALEKVGAPDTVDATFGTNGGTNGANAFIGDNFYAAEQTSFKVNGTDDSTAINGAIAAVPTGNSKNLVICSDCAFSHWGAWGAQIDRDVSGTAVTDHAELIPYIAGQVTSDAQLSSLATGGVDTIDYQGEAIASFATSSGIENTDGFMEAEIDITNRALNSLNLNGFSPMALGNTDISMTDGPVAFKNGTATFNNVPLSGNAAIQGTLTGTANGALFGPNAEEIGGNFQVQGTGVQGAGIYLGRDDNL